MYEKWTFQKINILWRGEYIMKKVVEFLQANPEVEICVSSQEYAWIRLNGKAVFENNMKAQDVIMYKYIYQNNKISQKIYKNVYNNDSDN